MIISKHSTSQEAWEWINEFLAMKEPEVVANGGVRSGPQMISYDHFMEINKAWVDPEFDFGKMFGYRIQKWSKLISNYIDFDFLDIARSQVLERENKRAQHYTVVYKFSNTQTSGHACLISLVFQRRITQDNPIVVMNIRSSEVTKRLLMDFLLVERIIEYVYGPKHGASIKVYCANVYLSGEAFTMYNTLKPLRNLLAGNDTPMAGRILGLLDKFEKPESLNIKYRVHLRAVKRLHNIDVKSLFAKNLKLFPDQITNSDEKKPKKLLKKNTINK
jgi:hypothetical protein